MYPARLTGGPGLSGMKGTRNKMEDELEEIIEIMEREMDEEMPENNGSCPFPKREDKERNELLKCIKGKTLSEAKEFVFVVKHEMPLNAYRKLH